MTRSAFDYVDGVLHAEGVSAVSLAEQFGTPLVRLLARRADRSWNALRRRLRRPSRDCAFAIKANSNLAVLNVFARLGAGFDIVSGGELARVLAAGGEPANTVFSGVGKTAAEMRQALAAGIKCFNVESIPELRRLNAVAAEMGKTAPVSLRVNPNVDAKTHPYISTGLKANKFGVAFDDARATYHRRGGAGGAGGGRHRLPYRLADHRSRALSRGGGRLLELVEPIEARRRGDSATSTSAAAWASPTTTKRRRKSASSCAPCSSASKRAATVSAK